LNKRTALIGGGVIAVVVAASVTAVALTGNDSKKAASPPAPVVTPSTSASTPSAAPVKATPKPAAPVNPLTGVGAVPRGPVLAVKIDDTENGRPSVGLDQADIVYIEQAEGGLTRMVAVFASHKPTVEAVRSVRASDAELLSQYGPISLVASGGGGDSLTTLDASIVKGIIDDRGAPGFARDGNRSAPYNLTANLAQMSADAKTAAVKDVGFVFSKVPGADAKPGSGTIVNTVVGSTGVTFVWDPKHSRYVRTIDGQNLMLADGNVASAPNVLIQFCTVTTNPGDVDVNGNPSQFTHSVGRGKAVLFRNGRQYDGTWSRLSATSPTHFVDSATGKAMTMAPGGAYVVLAATGAPA
jgi:hypothetical protein